MTAFAEFPIHSPQRKPPKWVARVWETKSTKGKTAYMKLKKILLSSVTALTVLVRGTSALAVAPATTTPNPANVSADSGDSKDQPKPPKDKGDQKDQSDAGDHNDQPKPPKDKGDKGDKGNNGFGNGGNDGVPGNSGKQDKTR